MTPKQIERIQNKILKIKRELAYDKRRHGFHDDSRGLRYLPPELFLKLQDYSGALRYFNWFDKNFSDDSGYPTFLFEWTITLFKNGKIKEAEKMTLKTFFSNIYIIDKFLENEFLNLDIKHMSNWEVESMAEELLYNKNQIEYIDFANWLSNFVRSQNFNEYANEFLDIQKKLKHEPVGETRSNLIVRLYSMLENYK